MKEGEFELGLSEPSFGVDSFNKAKYKNETEAIANSILAVLFGKPGFFPSMPELGLNIQQLIYSFWDEIDEDMLKAEIATQCSSFKEYIDDGSLDVVKSSYMSKPLLIIVIPVQIKYTKANLALGISTDNNGKTQYNYVYEEGQ